MGIYGAYHVSLEGDEQTPRMAAQLAEQYPGRVHTADVSELYAEDPVLEEITVGEKTYTASYWGEQDISGFSKKLVSRKFWRLEDGAEDFANCPTVDDVLPYDNQYRTGFRPGLYGGGRYGDPAFLSRRRHFLE